jgi:hypothetical protein
LSERTEIVAEIRKNTDNAKVKTKDDAVAALEASVELKEIAEALMQEHGITEMLEAAEELKKKVTKYATSKSIDKLDLPDGRYGRLITSVHERLWVGTKADMPADAGNKVKPLKSLVPKEVWMKITKRVPDPEKIDEAVSEGLISHDQIEAAYFEKMKAPYIRVFGEKE